MLYLKDTEKWKQFTTTVKKRNQKSLLCYISKILKNESNSQHTTILTKQEEVVLYLKDTEKWKQFTTQYKRFLSCAELCYISKILKNESNSQLFQMVLVIWVCCVISQRYWKMKAIHNLKLQLCDFIYVVLYLKDTEKWKQFTTRSLLFLYYNSLCYISKILKNESNSQHWRKPKHDGGCCVISQRYWKMKAIHNNKFTFTLFPSVVLYLKDTEKWKQFTTLSDLTP